MLLKSQHEFTLYIHLFFFSPLTKSACRERFDFSKCRFPWSYKVNVFGSFLVGRGIWGVLTLHLKASEVAVRMMIYLLKRRVVVVKSYLMQGS